MLIGLLNVVILKSCSPPYLLIRFISNLTDITYVGHFVAFNTFTSVLCRQQFNTLLKYVQRTVSHVKSHYKNLSGN